MNRALDRDIDRALRLFRSGRYFEVLQAYEAYLDRRKTGKHYAFKSKKIHTDVFYDMKRALQFRHVCELSVLMLLSGLREAGVLNQINLIMGPERGAVPLLYAIEPYLPSRDVRIVIAQKSGIEQNLWQLPQGSVFQADDRALYLDDTWRRGDTFKEVQRVCNEEALHTKRSTRIEGSDEIASEVTVVAIGVCVNRAATCWSPRRFMPSISWVENIHDPLEAYPEDNCPWCKENVPVESVE